MDDFFVENIYYLGPNGSNVNKAMLKFIDICKIKYNNLIPKQGIKAVLEAHKNDNCSCCVLPIENSIEGIVRETIDNLLRLKDDTIKIQGELSLEINHLLLGFGHDKSKIKKIISHPQALSQCSKYLYNNFPNAELKEFSSTSYAAQKVAANQDESLAAIANETCAEIFNLNILERDLNDEKDNKTRFYLLGRNSNHTTKNNKTAIMLSIKNQAGALCNVLKVFLKHDINLTYIDSRPSKKQLGEYLFFIELEGDENNTQVKESLKELNQIVEFSKILGSFPILL